MQQKIAIRKKAFINRKKKYFDIPSKFFYPLIKLFKKNTTNIVSLYYPSNYEVNVLTLFQLIKRFKIKTLLPVVKPKRKMNFVEWQQLDPLKVNEFGMLEPCLTNTPLIPDFMLVPLLAFDSNNNRLGYGKGFYDKFLRNKKKITTIGIAFSFQKYNKLPVSNLDIKLDYILTERGIKKWE